jgi:hypothetical protein
MTPSSDEAWREVRRLGMAGITAMTRSPGLAAAVDQHAAAVRDVITASGGTVHADSLRDYLDGFAQVAMDRGWRPDADGEPADDEDHSWQTMRVLAVYRMLEDERREVDLPDELLG